METILENVVTILGQVMSALGIHDAWILLSAVLVLLAFILIILLIRSRHVSHKRAARIEDLNTQVMCLEAQTALSGGMMSESGESIIYQPTGSIPKIPYEEFPGGDLDIDTVPAEAPLSAPADTTSLYEEMCAWNAAAADTAPVPVQKPADISAPAPQSAARSASTARSMVAGISQVIPPEATGEDKPQKVVAGSAAMPMSPHAGRHSRVAGSAHPTNTGASVRDIGAQIGGISGSERTVAHVQTGSPAAQQQEPSDAPEPESAGRSAHSVPTYTGLQVEAEPDENWVPQNDEQLDSQVDAILNRIKKNL